MYKVENNSSSIIDNNSWVMKYIICMHVKFPASQIFPYGVEMSTNYGNIYQKFPGAEFPFIFLPRGGKVC